MAVEMRDVPPGARDVWARIDGLEPSAVVVLKPDHVRDVDLSVRWYGARAYGPQLFWRDDVPRTELVPVHPGDELPGGLRGAVRRSWRDGDAGVPPPASARWSSPTA